MFCVNDLPSITHKLFGRCRDRIKFSRADSAKTSTCFPSCMGEAPMKSVELFISMKLLCMCVAFAKMGHVVAPPSGWVWCCLCSLPHFSFLRWVSSCFQKPSVLEMWFTPPAKSQTKCNPFWVSKKSQTSKRSFCPSGFIFSPLLGCVHSYFLGYLWEAFWLCVDHSTSQRNIVFSPFLGSVLCVLPGSHT